MLQSSVGFIFLGSLFTGWTEGPTFVHTSITEEEVEHVLHMSRDAVWNSTGAPHRLFLLCGGQLLVCANASHLKSRHVNKHTLELPGDHNFPPLPFIYSKPVTQWRIIPFCRSTRELATRAHTPHRLFEHFPANHRWQTYFRAPHHVLTLLLLLPFVPLWPVWVWFDPGSANLKSK